MSSTPHSTSQNKLAPHSESVETISIEKLHNDESSMDLLTQEELDSLHFEEQREVDFAESDRSTTFVWPPLSDSNATIEVPSYTQTKNTPDSSNIKRQFRSLNTASHVLTACRESIEVQLLGRKEIPFREWATRTHWEPNSTDQYCWRCAGSIGPFESDGDGCAQCRSKKLPWQRAIRIALYHGEIQHYIKGLKFHRWRKCGEELGAQLGRVIIQNMEIAGLNKEEILLVPIPMHRYRRMSRGIDHTKVLTESAAEVIGCQWESILCTHFRPEQVGQTKSARSENIKDCFYLHPRFLKNRIAEKHKKRFSNFRVIILIDDVRTTGATFVAASKALKSSLRSSNLGFLESYNRYEIWISSIAVAGERNRHVQKGAEGAEIERNVENC